MMKTLRSPCSDLALGALSLFTFPLIGHTLHLSDHAYGLWADSRSTTPRKHCSGALYSMPPASWPSSRRPRASHDRLRRARLWRSIGPAAAKQDREQTAFLWQKFPKFVLGFLLISILATVPFLHQGARPRAGDLSRWAFLLTFAGVAAPISVKCASKACARSRWCHRRKWSSRLHISVGSRSRKPSASNWVKTKRRMRAQSSLLPRCSELCVLCVASLPLSNS